jgi:hypothetical protein
LYGRVFQSIQPAAVNAEIQAVPVSVLIRMTNPSFVQIAVVVFWFLLAYRKHFDYTAWASNCNTDFAIFIGYFAYTFHGCSQ